MSANDSGSLVASALCEVDQMLSSSSHPWESRCQALWPAARRWWARRDEDVECSRIGAVAHAALLAGCMDIRSMDSSLRVLLSQAFVTSCCTCSGRSSGMGDRRDSRRACSRAMQSRAVWYLAGSGRLTHGWVWMSAMLGRTSGFLSRRMSRSCLALSEIWAKGSGWGRESEITDRGGVHAQGVPQAGA